MSPGDTATIMVIDDQPANLSLLEAMLSQQGYKVRSFPRGRLGLVAAVQRPPDLILLDINMPEMDGFEVCERLKASARLGRIPIIFLSALSETEDKVKAFKAGGVDYITKPFQFEEVLSRVETHLLIYRLQRELKEHNERLEEQVRARTCDLAAANLRLRILDQAKSDFLRLISHEFRTPLTGILSLGDMLFGESGLSTEAKELRTVFEQARRRIITILDHASLLAQMELEGEDLRPGCARLGAILAAAIEQATELAWDRQVLLELTPDGAPVVLGSEGLLVKAFHALIETAIKLSDRGGPVELICETTSDAIEVRIETKGITLPPGALPKFFEVFSIGETLAPEGDLGLGPAVGARIISLFGGSVSVENREPPGIRMTVVLKHPSKEGSPRTTAPRALA